MKKAHHFLIILFCLLNLHSFSQLKVDTVINKGIYQSFFNYHIKQPLYVAYKLHKGGGPCDRDVENFDFFVDDFDRTATGKDYTGSKLDKGHLANAEDFAFDCDKEELTFRYYNCTPQTVKLNRGTWKTWEGKIRDLSQTKKLFIVAGAIYGTKKIGPNKIGVPSFCYKIVLNAQTKKMIYCLIFPNDKSNTFQNITLKALKKKMKYDLMPASYWNNL
jgi:DNA/RNA endonuclease G (NUC1)